MTAYICTTTMICNAVKLELLVDCVSITKSLIRAVCVLNGILIELCTIELWNAMSHDNGYSLLFRAR